MRHVNMNTETQTCQDKDRNEKGTDPTDPSNCFVTTLGPTPSHRGLESSAGLVDADGSCPLWRTKQIVNSCFHFFISNNHAPPPVIAWTHGSCWSQGGGIQHAAVPPAPHRTTPFNAGSVRCELVLWIFPNLS